MNREDKIGRKVEEAMGVLHNPQRYEGSSELDQRIKAIVRQEPIREMKPVFLKLAGVAAVVLFLLNVAFLTQRISFESESRAEGLDWMLEEYTLVPAADWDNYLTQNENE